MSQTAAQFPGFGKVISYFSISGSSFPCLYLLNVTEIIEKTYRGNGLQTRLIHAHSEIHL